MRETLNQEQTTKLQEPPKRSSKAVFLGGLNPEREIEREGEAATAGEGLQIIHGTRLRGVKQIANCSFSPGSLDINKNCGKYV